MMYTWAIVKEVTDRYALSVSYIECVNNYTVWLSRDMKTFECKILKTEPKNDDQIDFETNYKGL